MRDPTIRPLQVWMPLDLKERYSLACQKQRRSMTQQMLVLIERFVEQAETGDQLERLPPLMDDETAAACLGEVQ